MGCGPSNVNPGDSSASTPRDKPLDNPQKSMSNGYAATVEKENKKNTKISTTDSNANKQDIQSNNPGNSYIFFFILVSLSTFLSFG